MPPVAAAVLGDPHVEIDSNPLNPAGFAEAFPSVASATGKVSNLHVYVDAGTTVGTLFAGIYSDNGGHPGTLLTSGTVDEPVENAWNTIAVADQRLVAGTTYWIAVLGADGGMLGYRDRCCTGARGSGPTESDADRSLSELPAHWKTGTVYPTDGPMSVNASG